MKWMTTILYNVERPIMINLNEQPEAVLQLLNGNRVLLDGEKFVFENLEFGLVALIKADSPGLHNYDQDAVDACYHSQFKHLRRVEDRAAGMSREEMTECIRNKTYMVE